MFVDFFTFDIWNTLSTIMTSFPFFKAVMIFSPYFLDKDDLSYENIAFE